VIVKRVYDKMPKSISVCGQVNDRFSNPQIHLFKYLHMDITFPILASNHFFLFFRQPDEKKKKTGTKAAIREKSQKKEKTSSENFILCKYCGHKITTPDASITFGHSHQHTFANPAGLLFDIGCFKSAPGCLNTGPFTDEFSWFQGYRWRISICESCHTHIGWMFGSANHIFFGLILDRLTDARNLSNRP
jgi:hypothetical protein